MSDISMLLLWPTTLEVDEGGMTKRLNLSTHKRNKNNNSVAFSPQTILTERQPLVGEI
jgi:hypothetical protein